MRKIIRLFLLLLFFSTISHAQTSCLLPEKTCDYVLTELSGMRALDLVREIARFDRVDASPGYHQAVLYLRNKLEQISLGRIAVEEFISDGRTKYFSMRSRFGWDARKGELWLIDPETNEETDKFADFSEVNTSLANYSISADTIAEIVDIGDGIADENYAGKDIAGKIVLTSGDIASVQEKAVGTYGALGIISYWSNPQLSHMPQLINWLDTYNNWTENRTFGFVLSREQGVKLKQMLKEKDYKAHAIVNANLTYSKLENLTAVIPGTKYPEEEILLIAHLCHYKPGANDNASGSALLYEIAYTLKELVRKGYVVPPERSIRFMWVPENYGTVAYLQKHPEFSGRVIACINMDMVGENLKKCDSIFRIFRTPDSIPSYLNDLIVNFTRYIDTKVVESPGVPPNYFNYRIMPAIFGSDHYWINDGGIRVPAVSLTHWPDNFFHTHQDSPDKCDPVELKRVGFIGTCAALFLSGITRQQTLALADEVAAEGVKRISESVKKGIQIINKTDYSNLDPVFHIMQKKIDYTINREKNAVLSTKRFYNSENILSYIDNLALRIEAVGNSIKNSLIKHYESLCTHYGKEPKIEVLSDSEREAERIIPKRTKLFLSALWKDYLEETNVSEEEWKIVNGFYDSMEDAEMKIYELLNFIDGKKSLLEIRDRVSIEEFGVRAFSDYAGSYEIFSLDYARIDMEQLTAFMRIFEKTGLVSLE